MIENISFIGAGSMAEAIIEGMINKNVLKSEQIYVANKKEMIQDSEAVVFATKPFDMEDAIMEVKEFIQPHHLVISVVAGISTDFIAQTINKEIPVIRVMPNTSAAIGHSATAIAKGKYATDSQLLIAKSLFEAIGTVSIVEEDKMHIEIGRASCRERV